MKLIYSLISSLLILLCFSCEKTESILYDNVARIYFSSDSLNYSFGDKPFSIQKDTVMFPVKIMGAQSKEIRKFVLELDEKGTTAIAGVQYTKLKKEYEVLVDSVNAYIPIELIRKNITGAEVYKIAFKLKDGGDFNVGVKESLFASLSFNNYLEKPNWWGWLEASSLGVYQQEKYQKYIEIHGSAIDDSYLGSNFIAVVKEFHQVANYFAAHPEYGVTFPADAWWP